MIPDDKYLSFSAWHYQKKEREWEGEIMVSRPTIIANGIERRMKNLTRYPKQKGLSSLLLPKTSSSSWRWLHSDLRFGSWSLYLITILVLPPLLSLSFNQQLRGLLDCSCCARCIAYLFPLSFPLEEVEAKRLTTHLRGFSHSFHCEEWYNSSSSLTTLAVTHNCQGRCLVEEHHFLREKNHIWSEKWIVECVKLVNLSRLPSSVPFILFLLLTGVRKHLSSSLSAPHMMTEPRTTRESELY